jgi:hypothetical protein
MTKPISFKQAGVIVIALHVAGFIGFTQYASYKARVARELREEKKAEMVAGNHLKQDWNNSNIKPKIVATAAPKRTDEIKPSAPNQIQQVLQKAETVAQTAAENIKEKATEVTTLATTSMQALNSKPREIVKPLLPAPLVKQPTKKPAVVSNQTATKKAFLATKQQRIQPPVHSSPKINIDTLKENVQVIKREVRRMTSEGIEHESYSVQRMPVTSGHTQVFVMGSDLLEAY